MIGWRRAVAIAGLALVLTALGCSKTPTGPNDAIWHVLSGHVESLVYPPFRDGRQCWVYLPPGYATSGRRYPVLYLNDGEVMFDVNVGIHLNRVCDALIRGGQMEPIIMVAITNGPGDQRYFDYTPWEDPQRLPTGGGDAYLHAVVDTLKPEVDRRYRTLIDPEHTGIAGPSLGGLISVYAVYAFPATFGRVGAFSPSYWWARYKLEQYAFATGRPAHFRRFYQDTGEPHDNYIDGMEWVALQQGFVLGQDFYSAVDTGAVHTTAAWAHRAPTMLRFLYPR